MRAPNRVRLRNEAGELGETATRPFVYGTVKVVGKILRVTLDGKPIEENPFYDLGNGVSAEDYVFAYGIRNAFGGAWRHADAAHYFVENGPGVDRFARTIGGENYRWPQEQDVGHGALYGNRARPRTVHFRVVSGR